MNLDRFKDFIKQNYQIVYSLLLIIVIPLALFYHTFTVVNDMQSNMDVELQSKALLIENVIETAVADNLEPSLLQKKIDRIAEENIEIQSLKIAVPDNDVFKIIAAKNKDEIGQTIQETQNILAWHEDSAFAHLTIENSNRFWEVTKAIRSYDNDRQGLIIIRLALANIDALTLKTIKQAYLLLIAIVIIILLLVINNTKLFQQANLYYKLREVDRMKDEFISMVSHELRTPITAIRGYLSFIFDDHKRTIDDITKKDLENVRLSSDLLGLLVDDILEVTRIEQGKVKLSLAPTDIIVIINEVINELKIKAQEKNLEIVYEKTDVLPKSYVDKMRLKQIMINLIGNAIKYTPQGKITINSILDEKEGKIKIKVADTGLGMSAKAREQLFQKFYRIKNRETDDIIGTGLGLWITKNLTEMMNGEIYVDSIEGTGSVFTVLLPIVKESRYLDSKASKIS